MVITPRGAELRPIVRAAVLAMEQVFNPQPEFSPGSLTQSFSLILTDLLEMTLLPEIDRQLRLEAPNVNLQSLPAGMNAIAELRQGRADAAVNAMSTFLDLKVKKPPFPLGGFNYDLVWHKRAEEDPAQRWFRDMVMDCARRITASSLS